MTGQRDRPTSQTSIENIETETETDRGGEFARCWLDMQAAARMAVIRALVDRQPVPAVVHQVGVIVHCNRAFAELFDCCLPPDFTGVNFLTVLMPPEEQPAVLARLAEGGHQCYRTRAWFCRNPEPCRVSIESHPLPAWLGPVRLAFVEKEENRDVLYDDGDVVITEGDVDRAIEKGCERLGDDFAALLKGKGE